MRRPAATVETAQGGPERLAKWRALGLAKLAVVPWRLGGRDRLFRALRLNCTNDREVYCFHLGGANAGFADGSVHFLKETSTFVTSPAS